jgi:hypothetical protein
MHFDTFWTHKLETTALCAKVGDGLFFMLVAGDIVAEVGLHILECEGLLHFKVISK